MDNQKNINKALHGKKFVQQVRCEDVVACVEVAQKMGRSCGNFFQDLQNLSGRAHEQCDADCEIKASEVHRHVHLEMWTQENPDGFGNGEQSVKTVC